MAELRLFIAVPVPGPVKQALADAQQMIGRANPHVRLTGMSGIHLTLKFLGDADERKIPEIRRAMEAAVATVAAPIHLAVRDVGAFPDRQAPRVLWAGLEADVKPLGILLRKLDKELSALGFPPEKRGFHPHLTLGRMKQPKMLGALHKVYDQLAGRDFGEFTAEALVLYRSELRPEGAEYTVLERVELPIN